MAGIGLRYNVYAPLTENVEAGTFSYGTGKRGRKMIKADIKITYDDSKLRAEDDVGESLKEFVDGAINVEQDEFTPTMKKDLLGNTASNITVGTETVEEISSKDTDTPPVVGYGYIQSKIVDRVRKYRAVFYPKVQFGEPDDSAETKGERIVWQTPKIVGTIMRRIDGSWKEEIEVASLDTAIAYLKGKVNLT